MKFHAVIVLVAVCLIQGNSARPQWGSFRNFFSNAQNAAVNAVQDAADKVQNAASDAANSVQNAATGAFSKAQNAASDAANKVQDAAANALDSAQSVASNAVNSAQNAATSAFNSAQNAATNAFTSALDVAQTTAENIRSRLSDAAHEVLDIASSSASLDTIKDAVNKLDTNQLLETIKGAQAEVEARAEAVTESIQNTVNTLQQRALSAVQERTAGWNSNVRKVVNKAAAAGVDVSSCAVEGVLDVGKAAAVDAMKCVTNKAADATTLAINIANIVPRSANLARDGVTAYRTCREKGTALERRTCQITKLSPVAYKSALLVKDTIRYAREATTLVTTIQPQLTECATGAIAGAGVEAVKRSGQIVSCVRDRMASAGAA